MPRKRQEGRIVTSARTYRDTLPRLNTLKFAHNLTAQEDVLDLAINALERQDRASRRLLAKPPEGAGK